MPAKITRFFYQNGLLHTLKTGDEGRVIFRTPDMPLAEQGADNAQNNGLLATDDKGSVLQVQGSAVEKPCADQA
ncbi:hypothetical protein D3C81_1204640 [compost metagenome]|jgi:hypothetical protein